MKSAQEMNQIAVDYEKKRTLAARAATLAWVENELMPRIQERAEIGKFFLYVTFPTEHEYYAIEALTENGYEVTHYSGAKYQIGW